MFPTTPFVLLCIMNFSFSPFIFSNPYPHAEDYEANYFIRRGGIYHFNLISINKIISLLLEVTAANAILSSLDESLQTELKRFRRCGATLISAAMARVNSAGDKNIPRAFISYTVLMAPDVIWIRVIVTHNERLRDDLVSSPVLLNGLPCVCMYVSYLPVGASWRKPSCQIHCSRARRETRATIKTPFFILIAISYPAISSFLTPRANRGKKRGASWQQNNCVSNWSPSRVCSVP